MTNDILGCLSALRVLDDKGRKLADDWQEIDRLLDRKRAMLRDALGLDVGPVKQPSFCFVCGDEVEDGQNFCSEACGNQYYAEADLYWDEREKEYLKEKDK
jgi:hypothetical protein